MTPTSAGRGRACPARVRGFTLAGRGRACPARVRGFTLAGRGRACPARVRGFTLAGRGWACPARSRGFTLLEVLLVLTIIGLAGAFLAPRLGDLDTRGFDVEVREAANLLNHARRNAIVSGNPATVSFLPETEDEPFDYRVPMFSAGVFEARDIELHFLDSAGRRETVEEPLEVTFFPEGGSTGGALLLLRGDRGASIEINPVTGRMETAYDEEPSR